jgi:hypothetical protein
MFYFIRNKETFSVSHAPPCEGIIYPEVAFSADQKVKLVDQRPVCEAAKFPLVRVYMPSLLKSNLQKAIRRRHIEEAFATAKHLLAQDAQELLRRLPIIMCEDTMLHPPLFMEIVWLMIAVSKGYVLTVDDCKHIMNFIGACLSAPAQYNILVTLPGGEAAVDLLNPLQLSFALRIEYGGMKCDMAFMKRLLGRIAIGELAQNLDFIQVDYESVGTFDLERHLIPEAVDFHCFPAMLKITEVPKPAIWHNRSAINVRPLIGAYAAEGAAREAEEAAAWPLSAENIATIEEFVEKTVAGLRGRAPPVHKVKQMRLTGFVKRC